MISADDWLIGEALPVVFTKHFGLPAEWSARPSPYVAFAVAVCKEKGLPLTQRQIIRICKAAGLPEEGPDA